MSFSVTFNHLEERIVERGVNANGKRFERFEYDNGHRGKRTFKYDSPPRGLTPDDGHVRYENARGGVTFTIRQVGGPERQIQCVDECFGPPDEDGYDVHFCGVPKAIANRLDHPVCFPQPPWPRYRPYRVPRSQVGHRGRGGEWVIKHPEETSWYEEEVAGGVEGGWGGRYVLWDESILPPDYGYDDHASEEEESQSGLQLETPPASGSTTHGAHLQRTIAVAACALEDEASDNDNKAKSESECASDSGPEDDTAAVAADTPGDEATASPSLVHTAVVTQRKSRKRTSYSAELDDAIFEAQMDSPNFNPDDYCSHIGRRFADMPQDFQDRYRQRRIDLRIRQDALRRSNVSM
ncbi:hypothetical protein A1Q1_03621 [Trichosporon asahii var. asahii CBS 2479]|uniref:Uncharacterized protein n=1 Tax=Trichosporon asahii var. asahii (strain ATCC 90039 / CBS 2479 / JCM 2466 / KCTC 7840 / NBRC 103889/ NCYC 2677 / UAMH 7654) TaxID=1186058 RepID=J6ESK8_TRIAS|nr:hypothetical protein A1Q1_03621 [Trichosporon asahii var. asahii CBS 2479]EJT47509.1 hypothetical protein A1Q1_03621 [Trichosporon asahii var. asahii CBS 2479]